MLYLDEWCMRNVFAHEQRRKIPTEVELSSIYIKCKIQTKIVVLERGLRKPLHRWWIQKKKIVFQLFGMETMADNRLSEINSVNKFYDHEWRRLWIVFRMRKRKWISCVRAVAVNATWACQLSLWQLNRIERDEDDRGEGKWEKENEFVLMSYWRQWLWNVMRCIQQHLHIVVVSSATKPV